MLDTLIRQTRDDMDAMRKCLEKEDRKALNDWIHHLSSSWEMIHAAKPLREMYENSIRCRNARMRSLFWHFKI